MQILKSFFVLFKTMTTIEYNLDNHKRRNKEVSRIDMKTSLEFKLYDERVQSLITTDDKLARLIGYIGNVDLEVENDGFQCIVKYIIGQQISDKARETIWQRLCNLCENLTPNRIYDLPYETLRSVGLSGRKVEYIKNLSISLIKKEIDFEKLSCLSNDEIVDRLTSVKGIGRWTAEMYIIFSLGRINVLSKSDGTIRRSLQWMYKLESLPGEKEVTYLFNRWKGYETIVSAYFWKSIALGLQQKPFDTIFTEGGNSYGYKL